MRTRVRKWGNSLAIRIPRSFATEAGIERDASVELTLDEGKLVIAPVEPPVPSLEELLAQITAENVHTEVATGPAQGGEAW